MSWIDQLKSTFLEDNRYMWMVEGLGVTLKITILELDMGQQSGSKQEKEYVKAVYCHPVYLTSMQSTDRKSTRLNSSHTS